MYIAHGKWYIIIVSPNEFSSKYFTATLDNFWNNPRARMRLFHCSFPQLSLSILIQLLDAVLHLRPALLLDFCFFVVVFVWNTGYAAPNFTLPLSRGTYYAPFPPIFTGMFEEVYITMQCLSCSHSPHIVGNISYLDHSCPSNIENSVTLSSKNVHS